METSKVVHQERSLATNEISPKDISDLSNSPPSNAKMARIRDQIAVVGIAGKFPSADNADDLYSGLLEGHIAIRSTEMQSPPNVHGCDWVPKAGTINNIEDFDYRLWNLSRTEATDMDPQQRLFLEAALQALDDAEMDTLGQKYNNIGLFVGTAPNIYHTFTEPVYGDSFQRANRGFVAPCISARTAYHLNLHGPNVTLNTNCASGTVALSLAIDALQGNKCEAAIVGGISVQLFR